MKNKRYYLDLAERWFDALLTEGEELELKAFLAGTDDPDFDEVKAVAGFFSAGKAVATGKASVDARRRFLPWAATVAIAASLVLIAAIGLYHRQNNCYVLNDMTATLEGVFGEGEDVGDELFDLFNPAL